MGVYERWILPRLLDLAMRNQLLDHYIESLNRCPYQKFRLRPEEPSRSSYQGLPTAAPWSGDRVGISADSRGAHRADDG